MGKGKEPLAVAGTCLEALKADDEVGVALAFCHGKPYASSDCRGVVGCVVACWEDGGVLVACAEACPLVPAAAQ